MEDPADHLGLVARIAMRFTSERPIEDTDEYADGCMGLWVACQRFNPSLGNQLSTFATYYINGYIKTGKRLKMPKGFRRLRRQGTPLVLSLADVFRSSEPGGGRSSPESFVPDAKADFHEKREREKTEAADILAEVLAAAGLPARERLVLHDRMIGLHLDEIGVELGVSKERVRQLEERALKKCQRTLERLYPSLMTASPKKAKPALSVTDRERYVLSELANGRRRAEIAANLNLTRQRIGQIAKTALAKGRGETLPKRRRKLSA